MILPLINFLYTGKIAGGRKDFPVFIKNAVAEKGAAGFDCF